LSEDLRSRIGRLIVGPGYNPALPLGEQAIAVWRGGQSNELENRPLLSMLFGAPKPKVELTAEEKSELTEWDIENLSLEEQKRVAQERLAERRAFKRTRIAIEN